MAHRNSVVRAPIHARAERQVPPADRQALIALARQLARERFAPRAGLYDASGHFPTEDYQDLHRHGLLAMTIPREHGGLGLDPLTFALVLKEIARGNSSTALTLNMHCTVLAIIDTMGSERQKERYFRAVVRDGKYFSTLTSEPGSSFRGRFTFSTTARPIEGGYLISGVKHFCSLSGASSFYFVWSRLEGSTDPRTGLLNAVIPASGAGVEVVEDWDAMAMRSTASNTVRFSHCFVPFSDTIGQPGEILQRDLTDAYMLGYAAVYLGIAEAALEFTVDFARGTVAEPEQEPLSADPTTQRHVGEMKLLVDSAATLVERAALAPREGDRHARTLALHEAKYASAEAALEITDCAVKVCGGRAILRQYPLERYVRDARAGGVMPPNNDRCIETIGRLALGLEAPVGFLSMD
ncbi:MAG: acyl-CoA/acyl-ACP dehydrogenase [Chloroflexi bacterium]|nr:acyl-CoA/acyl-ACP dehydrogenase [Chloroflexota bacterium]